MNKKIQKKLQEVLKSYPSLVSIIDAIADQGGRVVVVGGAVRDLLLGLPIKDLDIEVHHLSMHDLESILKKFGPVSLVGKAYGVLRLHGLDIDWSIPRTEGAGRKPRVTVDPFMSMKDAFRRRDLTINAMGIDLVSFELIDPFQGLKDLDVGLLRACDKEKFLEDPLRFFRVMQFIGRFAMQAAPSLNALCKTMSVDKVSVERIAEEMRKLLLASKQPSLAFRWLKKIGRLKDVFPELYDLIGVAQNPKWHPEGDVFEHTMQSLDAAAQVSYETDEQKLLVLYAALCHDLGKPKTTEEREGRIISYEHPRKGVPMTKKLLRRITRNKELTDKVAILVEYHMMPLEFTQSGAKFAAYKRLARKIAPLTLHELSLLAIADRRGRNGKKNEPLKSTPQDIKTFIRKAEEAGVLQDLEEPILQGRDLLDIVAPGPDMGRLLKEAYEIQLEEGIRNKEALKKRVVKK
jgi:tRNA nucleotidyltransferase (CCA-adding enzyme)